MANSVGRKFANFELLKSMPKKLFVYLLACDQNRIIEFLRIFNRENMERTFKYSSGCPHEGVHVSFIAQNYHSISGRINNGYYR